MALHSLLQTKTVSKLCSLKWMKKTHGFLYRSYLYAHSHHGGGKKRDVLHHVLQRKLSNNEVPNLNEYCLIDGFGQETARRFMHPYSTPLLEAVRRDTPKN